MCESTNNKLLWDFKIQTDNKTEYNKPDIVILDKIERKCLISEVACPLDIRVKGKEKEKIENYQYLRQELKRIWKLGRVTVVPVITGALGTVSKDIEKCLAEISVTCRLESLQIACLLGTARILLKVQSWTPKVTGGDFMFKEDLSNPSRMIMMMIMMMIITIISFHQSQVFTKGLLLYYLNLEVRHLSHLLFVGAKDFLSLSQPSGYSPSVMAL